MFIKASAKPAIVWKESKISYDQLSGEIKYFSTFFDKDKTEKIAIFSENRPEWIYTFYSGWLNQSQVVPIDFLAPADDLAYILNDCQPEVIFCSSETLKVFKEAKAQLNYKIKLVNFDEIKKTASKTADINIKPEDVHDTAVIIYTSGTTGSPKGVMLSFDNILANIEAVSNEVAIYNQQRNVLALLPFHHIFPLMGTIVAPLFVGSTIAISPTMESPDIIKTLQDNKVAIMIGVPRLYSAIRKGIMDKINANIVTRGLFKMAATINSQSFSRKLFKKIHQRFGGHVEYMVCGGAKLDEEIARDFKTMGFEMLEGFGMTEAAPMITFTRPGKWKIGSAGQSMPELQVKAFDGEIVAKGRNIMKGYYNRPEETAAVLKDGWLYTGDLGYIDEQGYIHITGRKKEIMVLSNGKNINPEEIENKVSAMSDNISEIGVYLKNDAIHAAILPDFRKLNEKGIVSIEEWFRWEVIDKYNTKAAPYKKINKFFLIKEELPKTRLGKIQRFKLELLNTLHLKQNKKEEQHPEYEEYNAIRAYLEEEKQIQIFPSDHLEIDLGLDSLDKISLLSFLQSTFGIELKEDILLHHPTVEKIAEFMREKKQKFSVEAVKWSEILKEKADLHLPKSWFTQNLFKNMSRALFKVYFRLKGEGTENIPEHGPLIIAPNHQSFFDGLFVTTFLKNKVMKNTYFYAKEKHVSKGWLKALANRNNVIVIDLNRNLKESLQKLAEVLRKGKNIIIFPEGTRTRNGQLGSFKKAFAILSRELNVPIIPVSIKGAFEALPKGSIIPRPLKKIQVKFFQPVYPEDKDYNALQEAVYQLLAAEQN